MSPRLRFWLFLLALILFSRMFQNRVLWAEEGLPLAAAQQMLAGHSLYRDIWFDKPPLLAWFYAGVLSIAGHNGYGLRMIGVVYLLATVAVGYALARRLWDESAARWAAFFLAFFTGFYVHSATVPLAADLLLVLPHLTAFYLLVAGQPLLGGFCAGLAFHLNFKALFILLAGALWILLNGGRARRLILWTAGAFLGVSAILGVLAATGAWNGYREQVWYWGGMYARAGFSESPWLLGLRRTLAYFGFHSALVIGAAAFLQRGKAYRLQMAAWIAVSFVAVILGARFFPRYYFQVLPPIALAAAAGWRAMTRLRPMLILLAVSLVVPAVRFGRVNLWLALRRPFEWRDIAMDLDSRRAGAEVARLTRPEGRIFVWGFRPEIYYYARRTAVSRFLESQPLTGVLADRHLERTDPFASELAAHNRQELARALRADPPAVIVDGLGPYNATLGIDKYSELKPLLDRYGLAVATRGSRIYRLKAGSTRSPIARTRRPVPLPSAGCRLGSPSFHNLQKANDLVAAECSLTDRHAQKFETLVTGLPQLLLHG